MTELSEELIHQKYWLEKKSLLQTAAELEIDHPASLVIYMRKHDIDLRIKDKRLYKKFCDPLSPSFIRANRDIIAKKEAKIMDLPKRAIPLTPQEIKEKMKQIFSDIKNDKDKGKF